MTVAQAAPGTYPSVMSIWNLLPAGVVSRAKTIAALVGAVAYVVVSYVPSLASNHYVAIAIAALTFLGVWKVPTANAKTVRNAA